MPTDYEARGRQRDDALLRRLQARLPPGTVVTVHDGLARINAEILAETLERQ